MDAGMAQRGGGGFRVDAATSHLHAQAYRQSACAFRPIAAHLCPMPTNLCTYNEPIFIHTRTHIEISIQMYAISVHVYKCVCAWAYAYACARARMRVFLCAMCATCVGARACVWAHRRREDEAVRSADAVPERER
jgi:hypothetical protein